MLRGQVVEVPLLEREVEVLALFLDGELRFPAPVLWKILEGEDPVVELVGLIDVAHFC